MDFGEASRMNDHPAATRTRSAAQTGLRLGERLRQLRVAAGMTQSEVAGERFSKEYVSQIERGKTRPTRETVEWLPPTLRGDAGFPPQRAPPHRSGPPGG